MAKKLTPTEELKILLAELESELLLYEWFINNKIYQKENEPLIVERINFLKLQICQIKKEFEQ